MKLLRRLAQITFLLAFVALLLATTWPLRSPVPVRAFLSLDPLAALSVLLSPARSLTALRLFWPALALLAATALLGRFFCGWVCPLGTCLDATDTALKPLRRGRAAGAPGVKYLLLIALLAAAPFGVQLVWLLDPIPLLTRTFATALMPLGSAGYDAALQPLRSAGLRLQPLPVHPFTLSLLTGGALLAIVLLGLISRRYWCRSLCPLGALLGLVGRWGRWRRRVTDNCRQCRLCSRDCKMGAIPAEQPTSTRQAECLQCYDCLECCDPSGTQITLGANPQSDPTVDVGRREFLAACATGVAYGAIARYGLAKEPLSARLLRPPGAVVRSPDGALAGLMSEDEFLSKCLRCGQCMKACITGGLQPAVLEAGLLGFYTPRLVPRLGQCEQGCAACGQVCPSGALVPFTVEEKKQIIIGEARIDRRRCLAWQAGSEYRQCLVCDEHCSYDAIQTRSHMGEDRPFVEEQICTGCGICEKACPVKSEAAILVYGLGQGH